MKHTKQKPMTMRTLASQLALSEGRKHQASVGDVREILALLSDIVYADVMNFQRSSCYRVLIRNGKRRAGLKELAKAITRKPKRKCRGRK